MKEIIEAVKGLIRPYIAVTGWTAFVVVVCIAVFKFLDAEMAKMFIIAFVASVNAIVGVWIGSRVKTKE